MPGDDQSRQPLQSEAVLRLRRQFCGSPSAGDGRPSRGDQRRYGAAKDRRKQRLDDRGVRLTKIGNRDGETERWREGEKERRRDREGPRDGGKEIQYLLALPPSLCLSVPLSLHLCGSV